MAESIVLVVEAVSKRNIGLEMFFCFFFSFLNQIMTDSPYSPERQASTAALTNKLFLLLS